MEKVTGIGGIFFRSKDPEKLGKWYAEHLGVDMTSGVWRQEAGPTVFAPFNHDTDYFDRPEQQWMINFRVTDLAVLIGQLKKSGIDVQTKPEWNTPEVGRFARIHDPDGNPIELWEPATDNDSQ
jgi:predicted enzyme related to lactoylglutathione lyase